MIFARMAEYVDCDFDSEPLALPDALAWVALVAGGFTTHLSYTSRQADTYAPPGTPSSAGPAGRQQGLGHPPGYDAARHRGMSLAMRTRSDGDRLVIANTGADGHVRQGSAGVPQPSVGSPRVRA